MQPRVAYRTHYQVDEPAIVRTVLKDCTSATQSSYDEVVADKLTKAATALGRRLNVAAARYAVDLCHALGVLSAHNVWTERGTLLVGVSSQDVTTADGLDLTDREKLAYFAVFMAGDGASLLYLLDFACRNSTLPGPDDDWNSLAGAMFTDIYSRYLDLAGTPADRVRLRQELDRLRTRPFAGKSGAHKMFIHLQTLVRLGLLARTDGGQSRTYAVTNDPKRRSCDLPSRLPDLMALERLDTDHQWLECASGTVVSTLEASTDDSLARRLMQAYLRIGSLKIDLCPLSTLTALARIDAASDGLLVSYTECLDAIGSLQKEHLRLIRLHVDRWGRPAYVKVDPQLANEVAGS